MEDTLGDRMKAFEAVETGRRLDPGLPIYARVDGRGFSRFTSGMARPFDMRMTLAMRALARTLLKETHARAAFVQSDEVSLVWDGADGETKAFFDAKVMKASGVVAGLASSAFLMEVMGSVDPDFRSYATRMPHFDCRIHNLPDREEVANAFLWRYLDARRNAVSMAARASFPHGDLQGVDAPRAIAMMAERGVDFFAYDEAFRRGTFLVRRTVERELAPDELARIPEHCRPVPGTRFARTVVTEAHVPFSGLANPVGFLLDGEEPVMASEMERAA